MVRFLLFENLESAPKTWNLLFSRDYEDAEQRDCNRKKTNGY